MAATNIGNPVGAVNLLDFGNPKIITMYPAAVTSGGVFVFASGAAANVSSGADSFVSSDIACVIDASGALFTGIAMHDAGSNVELAVATQGAFICVANGTVVAGQTVMCDGNNAVMPTGSTANSIIHGSARIGRALTAAGSTQYCLVHIQG